MLSTLDATAAQAANTNYRHEADLHAFYTYHNTENALRNQLLAACPEDYIYDLIHNKIGVINNVTKLEIRTLLWTTYGEITYADLDANLARMTKAWHPPTPIEFLFKQLEEAGTFAIAGNAAIGENNIVRSGYNTIFATGLFDFACREWLAKPDAAKTMPLFGAHFLATNRVVQSELLKKA
jgi:hypothetical protein